MPANWIHAVALAGLLVGGPAALAQTARMDAPAAPAVTDRRPTFGQTEAYVDDADPAHPIVVKFAVEKDDYTANVDHGDDGVLVTGTLADGKLTGSVMGRNVSTPNFSVPMDGRTLDLSLFGAVRHLKHVDPNVTSLPARPGGAPVAVAETTINGWRFPQPDGWAVRAQPGGVTATSPDGRAGFGLYYLADPGTTDPVAVVNQLLKQNGASHVADAGRNSTLGEHASRLAIDLTYTNGGGVDRHLHVEVTTRKDPGASHAVWVGVADATPDVWVAQGTALICMADHVRPADAGSPSDTATTPAAATADNPLGAPPKDAYVGTFSDATLTVTVEADADHPAGGYAGTIVRGTRRFTLAATRGADGLTGTFDDGAGHAFAATATVDAAGVMTLQTGGATYTLKP